MALLIFMLQVASCGELHAYNMYMYFQLVPYYRTVWPLILMVTAEHLLEYWMVHLELKYAYMYNNVLICCMGITYEIDSSIIIIVPQANNNIIHVQTL